MFCRIWDFDEVRSILTCPSVYRALGDDYAPPADQFQVNEHPDIWYLGVHGSSGLIGMFSLVPQNRICWELHVVLFPWVKTREKWEAARELPAWLSEHTECRRLTAAVPASNRPAIVYGTHGIGMRYVGRQHEAFMKDGKLEDLILLGLSNRMSDVSGQVGVP